MPRQSVVKKPWRFFTVFLNKREFVYKFLMKVCYNADIPVNWKIKDDNRTATYTRFAPPDA